MSQQQIHNLAEDNARFTSWGFRESKNGKNFEFLGLVGCIFVVLCVCVFLCVRQFTMWTRRDLAVHNIVHYRSPYCPKGEKNVDLLGLGLVRFFFPFCWQFCSWVCAVRTILVTSQSIWISVADLWCCAVILSPQNQKLHHTCMT